MEELRASCDIVAGDYHAFNWMELRRRRYRLLIPILVFEAMVLVGVAVARNPAALVALVPFPAAMALLVPLQRWRVGRMVQSSPLLSGRVDWRFNDDGVHVDDKAGTLSLKWSAFTGLEEGPDLFVLRLTPHFGRFVPKRAFGSPETQTAFVELVRKNLST